MSTTVQTTINDWYLRVCYIGDPTLVSPCGVRGNNARDTACMTGECPGHIRGYCSFRSNSDGRLSILRNGDLIKTLDYTRVVRFDR